MTSNALLIEKLHREDPPQPCQILKSRACLLLTLHLPSLLVPTTKAEGRGSARPAHEESKRRGGGSARPAREEFVSGHSVPGIITQYQGLLLSTRD